MMSNIKVSCSNDERHLSVQLDTDTDAGAQILLALTSQGGCSVCGNPLQISQIGYELSRQTTRKSHVVVHESTSNVSEESTKISKKKLSTKAVIDTLKLKKSGNKGAFSYYESPTGELVHLKYSKLHKSGYYWYGLTTSSLVLVENFDISSICFIVGDEGYVMLGLDIIKEYIKDAKKSHDESGEIRHYHCFIRLTPEPILFHYGEGESISVGEHYAPLEKINPDMLVSPQKEDVFGMEATPIYRGTTPHDLTKKPRLISDQNSRRTGKISSHISQFLPVRAALDLLVEQLIEENAPTIPINMLDHKIHQHLSGIRYELVTKENKLGQNKRGSRPSSGFPAHPEEDMPQMWTRSPDGVRLRKPLETRNKSAEKSRLRVRNTVLGGLGKSLQPYGALYESGLCMITGTGKKAKIGVTRAGAELAAISNPVLHRSDFKSLGGDDLKSRFSKEEIEWFWKHTMLNLKTEKTALIESLNFVSTESKHIQEITNHLVKTVSYVESLGTDGKPPQRRSYTSSLVNRWTGLGIFNRTSSGHYKASEMGLNLLLEVIDDNKPRWKTKSS